MRRTTFALSHTYESITILMPDNWFLPLNLNTNTLLFMVNRIFLPCEENESSGLVVYLLKNSFYFFPAVSDGKIAIVDYLF
jgi:hypothetical protein